jgi:hypothetical protein
MTSDSSQEALPQPGARALASRRDGARSRGPKTAAGLARSARNASSTACAAAGSCCSPTRMRPSTGPSRPRRERYRGSVLAELARRSAPTLVVGAGSQVRALAALKVLQADARELPGRTAPDAAPALLPPPRATTERTRESTLDQ